MRNLNIITFGKIKNAAVKELVEYYVKLLGRSFDLKFIEKTDVGERKIALEDVNWQGFLIVLSEFGSSYTTESFATKLSSWVDNFQDINFLIGNAYGVQKDLLQAADHVLALSGLTFPHELSIVLLLEQIYRATDIKHGGSYHK